MIQHHFHVHLLPHVGSIFGEVPFDLHFGQLLAPDFHVPVLEADEVGEDLLQALLQLLLLTPQIHQSIFSLLQGCLAAADFLLPCFHLLEEVLPLITDQKDRVYLLHFANQLFREDEFVKIEEMTYKKLEQKVLNECDIMAIIQKVALAIAKKKSKEEKDRQKETQAKAQAEAEKDGRADHGREAGSREKACGPR